MTLCAAIDSGSEQPYTYYHRGCICMDRNEDEKALKDFTSALTLDNGFIKAYISFQIHRTSMQR